MYVVCLYVCFQWWGPNLALWVQANTLNTELHPSRTQNCILTLTFYVVLIFAVLLFKLVFEKLLWVVGSYEAATLGINTQPVLVRFLWSVLADSIRCLLFGSRLTSSEVI